MTSSTDKRKVWRPKIIDRLTELWETSPSNATQIAKTLNKEFKTHFTRNAVIGKARYLGLTRKVSSSLEGIEPEPKPKPVIEESIPRPDDVERWRCLHPTNKPGPLGHPICGKRAQPGRNFCAEHIREKIRTKKPSVY